MGIFNNDIDKAVVSELVMDIMRDKFIDDYSHVIDGKILEVLKRQDVGDGYIRHNKSGRRRRKTNASHRCTNSVQQHRSRIDFYQPISKGVSYGKI